MSPYTVKTTIDNGEWHSITVDHKAEAYKWFDSVASHLSVEKRVVTLSDANGTVLDEVQV